MMHTRLSWWMCAFALSFVWSPRATAQPEAAAVTTTVPSLAEQGGTMDSAPAASTPPPSAAVPDAPTAPPPTAGAPSEHDTAPESNPYPTAKHRRWSHDDVDRVRAQLAAERAARVAEGDSDRPVVHGNAGAPFAIGLEADTIFHNDQGFRLFNEPKANARLGFWVGYDLLTLTRHLILSGELGFGAETIEGQGLFGGGGQARLATQTFSGALSVRWDACAFLAPQIRLWGGASRIDMQLNVDSESDGHERKLSGFGALGGGLFLHTPPRTFETRTGKRASLTLGVLVEGGYALRSPVDFALHTPGGDHAIRVVDAKLGRLDLSGAYIRTSLVVRF